MTSTCCPLKTCTLMNICLDRVPVTVELHGGLRHTYIDTVDTSSSPQDMRGCPTLYAKLSRSDEAVPRMLTMLVVLVESEMSNLRSRLMAPRTRPVRQTMLPTDRQTDTHTYTRTQYDRPRTDTRRTAVSLTTSSAPAVGPRDASNLIASQLQNYRELRYPDNAHLGE